MGELHGGERSALICLAGDPDVDSVLPLILFHVKKKRHLHAGGGETLVKGEKKKKRKMGGGGGGGGGGGAGLERLRKVTREKMTTLLQLEFVHWFGTDVFNCFIGTVSFGVYQF